MNETNIGETTRAWLARAVYRLSASAWPLLIPAALLLVFLVLLVTRPDLLATPPTIDLQLPSEKAIPPFKPVRPIDPEHDPVWQFRYGATGTEFRAGLPYWIFRVLPAIFREDFDGEGYEHFGFDGDDTQYYAEEPVPRGLALCDTKLELPLFHVNVALKRVAINCSGCHRGEYTVGMKRSLVDGMPNHTADLQGFKKFVGRALQSPRFTPERIIAAIDGELSKLNRPILDSKERFVYERIVEAMRLLGSQPTGGWMDAWHRPPNGPGRIDPSTR